MIDNNDLISRSELIKALNEAQVEFDEYYKGLGKAKVITDNVPTVEHEITDSFYIITQTGQRVEFEMKRPQGEWIYLDKDEPMKVECPFCHERKCCISNYCDYCGAKMKGGAE